MDDIKSGMGILSLWLSINEMVLNTLFNNQGAQFVMQYDKIQQSYQEQLIKAGVCPQKAEQAAKSLSIEELALIGEIWLDWGSLFTQAQISIS